ncbi:MAG: hypothetical protein UU31_C0011G0017, partial [Candidatus Uhrbacteria bacterium GW2011_GWA2_41_10]
PGDQPDKIFVRHEHRDYDINAKDEPSDDGHRSVFGAWIPGI